MLWFVDFSSEATVTAAQPEKKEYVFKNKKEAIEAFKNLLREKVSNCQVLKFNNVVRKAVIPNRLPCLNTETALSM